MHRNIIYFLLVGTALFGYPFKVNIAVASVPQADFFVAPNGDDESLGTHKKPFATLVRAQKAIRELKRNTPSRNLVVMLRGGTYRLSKTVVFNLDDSASKGRTISYIAYPNETPVLTSGLSITGWKKVQGNLAGLPEISQGKVWVAPIPKKIKTIKTLYNKSGMLPRARGAAFRPTKYYSYSRCPGNENITRNEDRWMLRHIDFPKGAIKNYSNLQDVEVRFLPVPWAINMLPLASVDEEKLVAKLAIDATAPPFRYTRKGKHSQEKWMWVENAIPCLDQQGEWVVDTQKRKLYLWPKGEISNEQIEAPRLIELIRIEGKIEDSVAADQPVRGLIFDGITFTHNERDTWDNSCKGLGIQHDWEMHDRATAAVRFRGVEDCSVRNCHFINCAGTAIRLDLHCQNNTIAHNLTEHVGGMGILLCGYGPGTKDVNKNNKIISNEIHHCGQINYAAHAIMLWQSGGNRVAHNLIYHCPRLAIGVSGVREVSFDPQTYFQESTKTIRWQEIPKNILNGKKWERFIPYLHAKNNLIELNDIHHVLQELGDGAAINVSGAGEGNLIRRNLIHDIKESRGMSAVRTDGWQRGTCYFQNIICNVSLGGYERKNYNHFENNILYNVGGGSKPYIDFCSFPQDTPVRGTRFQRNIYVDLGAKPLFYRDGFDPTRMRPNPMSSCDADYNIFYSSSDINFAKKFIDKMKKKGIEKHSLAVDPKFVDAAKGDFRLEPDSPALKLGFQPFDTSRIGLLSKNSNPTKPGNIKTP